MKVLDVAAREQWPQATAERRAASLMAASTAPGSNRMGEVMEGHPCVIRLLQLALGLTPPWTVSRSDFDPEAHRLDIQIDFTPGIRFACPVCGAADCPAYTPSERLGVTSTSSSTSLSDRPRAAHPLRDVRHQDGQRAMGAAGQRLHLAVRSVGHDHGLGHAGRRRGPDRGRTRHQAVAGGSPLRRSGAGAHRHLGCDPDRHRRDRARRGHDYITLFADIDQARVLFATEARTPQPSPRSPTTWSRMVVIRRRSQRSAST